MSPVSSKTQKYTSEALVRGAVSPLGSMDGKANRLHENLETEEVGREHDRHFAFNSMRLRPAGMGSMRTKSFTIVGLKTGSTRFGKTAAAAGSSTAARSPSALNSLQISIDAAPISGIRSVSSVGYQNNLEKFKQLPQLVKGHDDSLEEIGLASFSENEGAILPVTANGDDD